MAKANSTVAFKQRGAVNRPGVHAKSKTSNIKSSRNYKKKYKGQGR